VLELSRSLAICSSAGPVIVPSDVLPDASVDHWLNGEDVAWLHGAYGLVASVMRYVGEAMEQPSHSVSLVGPHDREPKVLHVLGDHIADLSVHGPRLADLYSLHERVMGGSDEPLAGLRHGAYAIGLIQV
jgi:hypothetical protein